MTICRIDHPSGASSAESVLSSGAGGVGEEAFLGLELVDAFLDGALADELVDAAGWA